MRRKHEGFRDTEKTYSGPKTHWEHTSMESSSAGKGAMYFRNYMHLQQGPKMLLCFPNLHSYLWKLSVPKETPAVSQILRPGSVREFNITGISQSELGSVTPSTATARGHKVPHPSGWGNGLCSEVMQPWIFPQKSRRDPTCTCIHGKMQFAEHRAWHWPWLFTPFAENKQADSSSESGIVNSTHIIGLVLYQYNNLLIPISWPVINKLALHQKMVWDVKGDLNNRSCHVSVFSASFHLFMCRARQIMKKVINRFGLKNVLKLAYILLIQTICPTPGAGWIMGRKYFTYWRYSMKFIASIFQQIPFSQF